MYTHILCIAYKYVYIHTHTCVHHTRTYPIRLTPIILTHRLPHTQQWPLPDPLLTPCWPLPGTFPSLTLDIYETPCSHNLLVTYEKIAHDVYTIWCIVYSVQYRVYTVQWIVYIIQWILYGDLIISTDFAVTFHVGQKLQCTVYSVQYTMYSVPCTMYRVQSTVYTVHCTLYHVSCKVYHVPCTVYSIQYIVYSVHWGETRRRYVDERRGGEEMRVWEARRRGDAGMRGEEERMGGEADREEGWEVVMRDGEWRRWGEATDKAEKVDEKKQQDRLTTW